MACDHNHHAHDGAPQIQDHAGALDDRALREEAVKRNEGEFRDEGAAKDGQHGLAAQSHRGKMAREWRAVEPGL